jgi:hypothetical protein
MNKTSATGDFIHQRKQFQQHDFDEYSENISVDVRKNLAPTVVVQSAIASFI